MPAPVRVRFAPSPTGEPHIGNIRAGLFDYLFARNTGGAFVIRVEDTDQNRLVPGSVEKMLEGLAWLGIDWDEGPDVGGPYGPYVQSERLHFYRQAVDRLLESGAAYTCYCSPERLDAVRAEQQARKEPPRYDRRCRDLPEDEKRALPDAVATPIVRHRVPDSGGTGWDDLVYGRIDFENATLDDAVLLKSDGFPTYHLASVVDDHLMEISHVLRGQEWIPSGPRHILLYAAFGWPPPLFVHLPHILGNDKAKLSKRHGATSVLSYRDQGYLPEALFNFLALLGWSYDDKTEIMSRSELIERFTLDRIGKTSAVFNQEKLLWMNGVYVQQLPVPDLAARMLPFLEAGLPAAAPVDPGYLEAIVPLVQDRLKLLTESAELTDFFFADVSIERGALLGKKGDLDPVAVAAALRRAAELLQTGPLTADHLEAPLREAAPALGLKVGDLFGAIRVAITGRSVSPPLIETMAVLGRDRCLQRIEAALAVLETREPLVS